ncbi:MAG: Calx-beta domain-containing protein [Allosphingosinicella sp.]
MRNATAVNEGSVLVFQVDRSAGATGTFSVNYATSNGTALAPGDYSPVSGTLVFTGTASQTVSVPTLADGLAEGAETMLLNLSSPTGGASVVIAQGSGSINASSAPPPPPPPPPSSPPLPPAPELNKPAVTDPEVESPASAPVTDPGLDTASAGAA